MKRIAVIGSGISGLTSAYLLSKKHQVSVFEKNNYLGGHTATVDVDYAGEQFVLDTGFIVFNNKTYPNFIKLLAKLDVKKKPTQMSFSVHNLHSGLEYNGHTLRSLFAQKRNFFNVKFWRLLYDVARFNRLCKEAFLQRTYQDKPQLTLSEFLEMHHFNDYFSEHYILPMAAAIWSASLAEIGQIQFLFFVNFFHNHGLLNITDRPQWYVVKGGSRNYIPALCKPFKERVFLNSDITHITRNNGKVQLHFAQQKGSETNEHLREFDEVILACHSDQALRLLADATQDEKNILGDITYSPNSVILHTDVNLLPKRKKAWASWNYALGHQTISNGKLSTSSLSIDKQSPAKVTYNMNILQGLDTEHTFCVSLNQKDAIKPEKILREFEYHHPEFSLTSLAAQKKRNTICGKQHTHFAGAYWYNGFHEDGVRSGIDVAERFSCRL